MTDVEWRGKVIIKNDQKFSIKSVVINLNKYSLEIALHWK